SRKSGGQVLMLASTPVSISEKEREILFRHHGSVKLISSKNSSRLTAPVPPVARAELPASQRPPPQESTDKGTKG
ncbi:hypothetical protein ACQ4OD_25135, partial [Pseudomonas sp. WC1]|uniref:hypothetical protein n=1 Tax=Pseudomonas sp. WC1 TaxID=3424772 RepID=UPI003D34B4AE